MTSVLFCSRVKDNPASDLKRLLDSTAEFTTPDERSQIEFLIKYDDDDDQRPPDSFFDQYPFTIRRFTWSRGEGRHSLHHAQRQMTFWSDDRNHVLDDLIGQIDQNIVVETSIDPKLQNIAEAASMIPLAAPGRRARTSRDWRASSAAAMRMSMARAAFLAAGLQSAPSEATRLACERKITPSSRTFSALAASVAPVVVMSTMSSAPPAAGAPSVAPRLSTMR